MAFIALLQGRQVWTRFSIRILGHRIRRFETAEHGAPHRHVGSAVRLKLGAVGPNLTFPHAIARKDAVVQPGEDREVGRRQRVRRARRPAFARCAVTARTVELIQIGAVCRPEDERRR